MVISVINRSASSTSAAVYWPRMAPLRSTSTWSKGGFRKKMHCHLEAGSPWRIKATGSFANCSSTRLNWFFASGVRVLKVINMRLSSSKGIFTLTLSAMRYGSTFTGGQPCGTSGKVSVYKGGTANSFFPKNLRKRKTSTGSNSARNKKSAFVFFIIACETCRRFIQKKRLKCAYTQASEMSYG